MTENQKLPPDALAYYLGLGAPRSYRAVAVHFGVSASTVAKRARAEHWQDQVRAFEKKALEAAMKQAEAALTEQSVRHLRGLTQRHKKAMDALEQIEIKTPEDALRVLEWTINEERKLRGLPGLVPRARRGKATRR